MFQFRNCSVAILPGSAPGLEQLMKLWSHVISKGDRKGGNRLFLNVRLDLGLLTDRFLNSPDRACNFRRSNF